MKKYQVVSRGDYESDKIAETYNEVLTGHGWKQTNDPEIVIAIGGDGTMIDAFKKYYYDEHTSFVGIHTGTLGFYADWGKEESNKLLQKIVTESEQVRTSEYPLIEFDFHLKSGEVITEIALNDVCIKSKTSSTFVMDVFIGGSLFESFRGDGLIMSTPSGSTAYNYSVGGAVIHPFIEVMQVAELASINNTEFRTLNRSFVLHSSQELELYPKNKDILISIDGKELELDGIYCVKGRVSTKKIKFLRFRPFPFWNRVREKFII